MWALCGGSALKPEGVKLEPVSRKTSSSLTSWSLITGLWRLWCQSANKTGGNEPLWTAGWTCGHADVMKELRHARFCPVTCGICLVCLEMYRRSEHGGQTCWRSNNVKRRSGSSLREELHVSTGLNWKLANSWLTSLAGLQPRLAAQKVKVRRPGDSGSGSGSQQQQQQHDGGEEKCHDTIRRNVSSCYRPNDATLSLQQNNFLRIRRSSG